MKPFNIDSLAGRRGLLAAWLIFGGLLLAVVMSGCGDGQSNSGIAEAAPPKTNGTSATGGNIQNGKQLFNAQGCIACHGETAQGDYGPKIAGTRLSFERFLSQLRNPRSTNPDKSMTPFEPELLSDAQAKDILAYLKSLK